MRVRMTLAYDGTPFHGFASNPDVRTVQDDLEAALATVLRQPTPVTCAGRTDRGVHARGQVVSFDAAADHFEATALTRALNRMLGPHVAVRGVARVADDFDARFSCVARSYRYRVLNAPTPDPLVHNLVWHVREPLDLAAMQLAADQIRGEHDFTTFSKKNTPPVVPISRLAAPSSVLWNSIPPTRSPSAVSPVSITASPNTKESAR